MATTYKALPQNEPSTLVGVNEMSAVFNIANTSGGNGFVINDVVQFFQIPLGATVVDFLLDLPILDSNVSPACVLDVGTNLSTANGGLNTNGILAAATSFTNFSVAGVLSKAGNVTNSNYQQASLPFYYEASTWGPGGGVQVAYAIFQVKIHTAPATTATTGKIWANIRYTMTEDASIFSLKNL